MWIWIAGWPTFSCDLIVGNDSRVVVFGDLPDVVAVLRQGGESLTKRLGV